MAALFTLGALLAWTRHLSGERGGAVLAVLCCYLALLCKEIAVVLPALLAAAPRAWQRVA